MVSRLDGGMAGFHSAQECVPHVRTGRNGSRASQAEGAEPMAEGEAQAGAHPWEKSYPENVDWNAPLPKAPLQPKLPVDRWSPRAAALSRMTSTVSPKPFPGPPPVRPAFS